MPQTPPPAHNPSSRPALAAFAKLLAYHVEKDTRPQSSQKNQLRSLKAIAREFNASTESIKNWTEGRLLPSRNSFSLIIKVLFGDNQSLLSEKTELQELYRLARDEKITCEIIKKESSLTNILRYEDDEINWSIIHVKRKIRPIEDDGSFENAPIRPPRHFMGREESIAAIDQGLSQPNHHAPLVALYGLRGVGKTALAAAYAEIRSYKYPVVMWIRAQSDVSIRSDLITLSRRLGWFDHSFSYEEDDIVLTEKTLHILREQGSGVLLIYDNALNPDAIWKYLPKGKNCAVIITSNYHAWGNIAEPIKVDVWPDSTGADYLIARTRRSYSLTEAESLSKSLGGLPLALEQAAAYCEKTSISFSEYQRRFENSPVMYLDDRENAPVDYHPEHLAEYNYKLTVARTFCLAIEEVRKRSDLAEKLIIYAAFLSEEIMPYFIFLEGRDQIGLDLNERVPGDSFDRIVSLLLSFSLIETTEIRYFHYKQRTVPALRMHRLIREVTKSLMAEKQRPYILSNWKLALMFLDQLTQYTLACHHLRPVLIRFLRRARETS